MTLSIWKQSSKNVSANKSKDSQKSGQIVEYEYKNLLLSYALNIQGPRTYSATGYVSSTDKSKIYQRFHTECTAPADAETSLTKLSEKAKELVEKQITTQLQRYADFETHQKEMKNDPNAPSALGKP